MVSVRREDLNDPEEHHKMMARKVDNSTFVWAIGLIASFLFALGLWCFNAVNGVRQDVTATNAAVLATNARVSVMIDSQNTSNAILQVAVGKMQADLEWIKRQLEDQKARR